MNPELAPAVSPTAVVSSRAELAAGVVVGPGVVVEDGVVVGADTRLLAGTVLHTGARIGARCSLGPYAVVGGEPMDASFRGEPSYVVVGDDVTLREFVSVHRSTGEGSRTSVGAGTLVMSYAHVSHNCVVGEGVTITTAVQLGGHVQVGDHAVLGSGSMMHQFGRVGAYAMFGAGSAANMDVLPFAMARGNPARHYRLNRVGLSRHGIDGERYRTLERALRFVRLRDRVALAELAEGSADVRFLVEFIESSKRGYCQFVRRS